MDVSKLIIKDFSAGLVKSPFFITGKFIWRRMKSKTSQFCFNNRISAGLVLAPGAAGMLPTILLHKQKTSLGNQTCSSFPY